MLNRFAFLQSDIIVDADDAAAAAGRTCLLYDMENPEMFIRIFSIFSLKLNICCFFFVSVGYDLANSMSRAICLLIDFIWTDSHSTQFSTYFSLSANLFCGQYTARYWMNATHLLWPSAPIRSFSPKLDVTLGELNQRFGPACVDYFSPCLLCGKKKSMTVCLHYASLISKIYSFEASYIGEIFIRYNFNITQNAINFCLIILHFDSVTLIRLGMVRCKKKLIFMRHTHRCTSYQQTGQTINNFKMKSVGGIKFHPKLIDTFIFLFFFFLIIRKLSKIIS